MRPRSEGRTDIASISGYVVRAANDEAEIYIYDEIGGGGFFSDGVTATQIRDDLKNIGKVKNLWIYLNSPGGDVFEAVAIHSQLLRFKARKTVHVDGLAASAASIIAMASDERQMAESAMFMIHDPWGGAIGTAEDMRHMATTLDKVRGQMIREYARVTGLSDEELDAMLLAETWMTSEQALEKGFVDSVTAPMDVAASIERFDLSKYRYRNVPKADAPKAVSDVAEAPATPLIRPKHDAALKAYGRMQMKLLARKRAA